MKFVGFFVCEESAKRIFSQEAQQPAAGNGNQILPFFLNFIHGAEIITLCQ